MEEFKGYLKYCKSNINSSENVHVVLGNESCDLDSTVSPLLFAFFLHKHKISPVFNESLVVPILNVSQTDFLIRTENCYVLREFGIDFDTLIFRNQIDFEQIKKLTVTLIDHHVLSDKDKVLEQFVVQILDHRPEDPSSPWRKSSKVVMNIQQVGSCATIVADEIFTVDCGVLSQELAFMLYEVIVFDTIALLPENGRATQKDITIAEKLEKMFNFDSQNRKKLFDKLWDVHNDVSSLTPYQLLNKDLKIVGEVSVPGLPMLVQQFLNIEGSYDGIVNLADEKSSLVVVLVGLEARETVKREVAIYWKPSGEELKNSILKNLQDSEKLKGYNFSFQLLPIEAENLILLRQDNNKLTRKHIIPIIKDTLLKFCKKDD